MNRYLIARQAAVVAAPPNAVRDALYAELLPNAEWRGTFTVEDEPGHVSAAEVEDFDLSLQGAWWYRGEWHLEPHPEGTLILYSVYNVATRARWGVSLANRFFVGFDRTVRNSLMEAASTVARVLGCPPPRLVQMGERQGE